MSGPQWTLGSKGSSIQKNVKIIPRLFLVLGLAGVSPILVLADGQFTVDEVKGASCEIQPAGAAWKPAKQGESFKVGSSGKTGSSSTFVVIFDAQSKFRLLPKAEVVISPETRDSKVRKVTELTMTVKKGGVEVTEVPQNYELKVQTPTAVCGAVGTTYTVKVDGQTKSTFECAEGEIMAESREDSSFKATGIRRGRTLEAQAMPGKENSYTQLSSKGEMQVAFGGSDKRDMEDGSQVQLAQEKTEDGTAVAVRVKEGGVGGKRAGRYLLVDNDVKDYSSGEGAQKVDDYIAAAQKEGKIKNGLASGDLDEAAREATAKRKALLDFRTIVREQVREGQDLRNSMPTQMPR